MNDDSTAIRLLDYPSYKVYIENHSFGIKIVIYDNNNRHVKTTRKTYNDLKNIKFNLIPLTIKRELDELKRAE